MAAAGSTKYDEPVERVYDDTIKFKYTQLEMAQVLYDQFTAGWRFMANIRGRSALAA